VRGVQPRHDLWLCQRLARFLTTLPLTSGSGSIGLPLRCGRLRRREPWGALTIASLPDRGQAVGLCRLCAAGVSGQYAVALWVRKISWPTGPLNSTFRSNQGSGVDDPARGGIAQDMSKRPSPRSLRPRPRVGQADRRRCTALRRPSCTAWLLFKLYTKPVHAAPAERPASASTRS
jgi:hypothetical protein